MKKIYASGIALFFGIASFSQSVGIGTTTPNTTAVLHIDAGTSTTKGLLITGTYNITSTVPDLGAGSRLMYYPGKAAFRTGYVSGTQWDDANIGVSSVAMGSSTTASGGYSTAIGFNSKASNLYATAMGHSTTASAQSSIAMGESTTASNSYATAMGYQTSSGGVASTAMGYQTTASGSMSTAMGANAIASNTLSTAIGLDITASGAYSTAMGSYVSTNDQTGSFIIGDNSTSTVLNSSATNQFTARFANGYVLKGGNVSLDGGLYLPSTGGTASALNHYEETTVNVNFSNGPSTYLSNYTIKLLRVGKQVTLTLPTDQIDLTVSGVNDIVLSFIPSRFIPATNIYLPVRIRNNGVDGMGLLWIRTDGAAWLKPSASGGGWSGSGNCGFYATALTYSIQ